MNQAAVNLQKTDWNIVHGSIDFPSSFLTAEKLCTSLTTLALCLPQECTWLVSPIPSSQRAKPESEFRSQLPTPMKISTIALTPSFRRAESTASSHKSDQADCLKITKVLILAEQVLLHLRPIRVAIERMVTFAGHWRYVCVCVSE